MKMLLKSIQPYFFAVAFVYMGLFYSISNTYAVGLFDFWSSNTTSDSSSSNVKYDVIYPKTTTDVIKPTTQVDTIYPKTTTTVTYPRTQNDSIYPSSNFEVIYPKTTSNSIYPKTTSDTVYPRNSFEVIYPKTTSNTIYPKTSYTNSNQDSYTVNYSNGGVYGSNSTYPRSTNYSNYSGDFTTSYGYAGSYSPSYSSQGYARGNSAPETQYAVKYSSYPASPAAASTHNTSPTSGDSMDFDVVYSNGYNTQSGFVCNVDDTTIDAGDKVEFSLDTPDGSTDYSYKWSGGGVRSSKKEFKHEFEDDGIYLVTVKITDDEDNISYATCPRVYVGNNDSGDFRVNYGNPEGDLAGASSVYLNQVPYTGAEENAKVIGFIALLAVWSAAVGYYIMKRKKKNSISTQIADFKKANLAARA